MRLLINLIHKPAFQKACALSDFTCSFGQEVDGCVEAFGYPIVFSADTDLRDQRHVFFGMHYVDAKHEMEWVVSLLPIPEDKGKYNAPNNEKYDPIKWYFENGPIEDNTNTEH